MSNTNGTPQKQGMGGNPGSTPTAHKYKIGKLKQTTTVQTNPETGVQFIDLKPRSNEKVHGVTRFANNYRVEKKFGQGTFGSVYKGVHLETQREVAMKRILINEENDLFPITAQREITILKKLNHKNIIKLIEMVYDTPPESQNGVTAVQEVSKNGQAPVVNKFFYMILPYMVSDLSGVLHNPRITLGMPEIKNIMLQLLEGLNYMHCTKYMHRDIKTANILIDHNGTVKLADFGLARLYYGSPPNQRFPGSAGSGAKYTSVVVTRWYRAPELVLGEKYYTTAVDIWGVGCVFAEFFEKKPILQGKSDIDQGHVIFKLMGTPTEEEWKLSRYLPGAQLTKTEYKSTLKERFGKYLTEAGLHLLAKLLALDPYKRYTAMAAKNDAFFKEEPLPAPQLLLPCEESHESDIKRYKEEMHQNMSQRAPTAPRGHISEADKEVNSQYSKSQHNRQPLKAPPSGPAKKSIPKSDPARMPESKTNLKRTAEPLPSRYNVNAAANEPLSLPPKPKKMNNGAHHQEAERGYRSGNQRNGTQNDYYRSGENGYGNYHQNGYRQQNYGRDYDRPPQESRYNNDRGPTTSNANRSRYQATSEPPRKASFPGSDNPLAARIGEVEMNKRENSHQRRWSNGHQSRYGQNHNGGNNYDRNRYQDEYDEESPQRDISNLY